MDAAALIKEVQSRFPNVVTDAQVNRGEATVVVKKEGLLSVARALKLDAAFSFNMLMDVFGVDYLHWEEKADRFEVIYNLFSFTHGHRIFVKVPVPEKEPSVDSVTSLWPAADWYERETWDMFGITFKGHPNLKRILMYDQFQGHPLRKDYVYNRRQPLIGPVN
jgi:NADH-quinone oxidoreductase subunit C